MRKSTDCRCAHEVILWLSKLIMPGFARVVGHGWKKRNNLVTGNKRSITEANRCRFRIRKEGGLGDKRRKRKKLDEGV